MPSEVTAEAKSGKNGQHLGSIWLTAARLPPEGWDSKIICAAWPPSLPTEKLINCLFGCLAIKAFLGWLAGWQGRLLINYGDPARIITNYH